ncbi:class F sortase [Arthrobacter sp. 2MCAF15]|uniref:class F sortase n=1 Tax=Arthrobacter sp. 2MCAF15 TaxID=3232984 RepID=UPI003F925DC1
MRSDLKGRRGRTIASAAAALLLAGGITTIGLGLHAQPPAPDGNDPASAAAPVPPAATATAAPAPSPSTAASAPPTAVRSPAPDAALPASTPVSVEVPSIGVNSTLLQLGKQANGEVATPPGEPGSPAGWYTNSAAPGQAGSAVILGHVNSTKSPIGVFYRLHELAPGQAITVTRSDHTAAVFTVDKVDVYRKANFPTVEVYKNADRPELRLITCGGYDPATGQYLDNTVVYAHLTSTHPA